MPFILIIIAGGLHPFVFIIILALGIRRKSNKASKFGPVCHKNDAPLYPVAFYVPFWVL